MAAAQHTRTPAALLAPGTPAPDFELESSPGKVLRLGDFRDRPVILAFYPADWSPVCGDQMALYNELLEEFAEHDAQLLGVSVDGVWCHAAFAEQRGLHFPLLSDFEPKGAVARRYGAYRESEGTSERALFVIDRDGTIRWSYCSPIGVNPGADGILRALESLERDARESAAEPPHPDAEHPHPAAEPPHPDAARPHSVRADAGGSAEARP